MMTTSSVPSSVPENVSVSRHATALEICDLVYGASVPSWDAIQRFYEPTATYENPLVTATSRSIIADIHAVASHLASVDAPKPIAVLYTLFGIKRDGKWIDPWFKALRVWSEVGDVCESESFDGHKRLMVEHTLHILIFPDWHSSGPPPPSTPHGFHSSEHSLSLHPPPSTLGLDFSLASPFHLRLPIMSRLSFNDAGRITYHRDLWDIKDLLGLVPGMSLAQWITGRLAAQGIRSLCWLGRSLVWSNPTLGQPKHCSRDEEWGTTADDRKPR